MYLHNLGISDEQIDQLIANEVFITAINKAVDNKLRIDLSTNVITSEAAIRLIRHLVSANKNDSVEITLDLSNNDITANQELWQLLADTCNLNVNKYSAEDANLENQVYDMIAATPLSINILENPISCFRLNHMKKHTIS